VTLRNYQPVAWVLYQRVIDQSKADIFINPGIHFYASCLKNKTWHFHRHHMSWFFVFCFFVFSELRCEVIVRFVDIDEFIDHNILNFLFMN
jgi:hypothetical protein